MCLKERKANTQRFLVEDGAAPSSASEAEWGADNTGDKAGARAIGT